MGNNIRSSSRPKALAPSIPMPPLADAMDAVHLSVDRFCLLAGVEALAEMMEEDATTVCGARHRRHGDRRGYRWGRTHSEIGYHGGKVKVARPRVRDRAGKEVSLESWQALRDGNLLLVSRSRARGRPATSAPNGPPKAGFFCPVAASHFSSDAPHRISKRSLTTGQNNPGRMTP